MPSIAYTTAPTVFGELLLAATKRGVAALSFGNDELELTAWLQSEFPGLTIQRDEAGTYQLLADTLEVLDGGGSHSIPLAAEGSDFQKRVWHTLRQIPCGTTRTYTQLAAMVGQPKAVRAVAGACANNPISLLVPCHRVVGADGTLRGYRWGLERKRRLLEHEARVVQSKQRSVMARSA